ncbi:hypothetical protein [Litorimonas haliclonae]|uniref:hypothetical protein n=1 Tax=Litorimonas haliclonae TaxID=2081977 RepID=UPI0039EF968F
MKTVFKLIFPALAAFVATGCSNPYDFATQKMQAHNQPYAAPQGYGAYGYQPPHQPGYYPVQNGNAPQYANPQTAAQLGLRGGPQQEYAPRNYANRGYGYNRAYQARAGAPRRSLINLNYETLNFFEAPLAKEIGDTTFLLRGRVDTPLSYSFKNDNDLDASVEGNFQISAETQLPNRLTLGALYAGSGIENNGVDYDDQVAVFAGGSWGTVFGGNVSNLVFENTRRRRGASTLELEGSNTLGTLANWSGGYQGRYGPMVVSGLYDEDDNYDIGVSVQRPMGNKDYRLSARHNTGQFTAADGLTEIDTRAVSAVGEYVYGSTRYDIGAGYEELENNGDQADRWFTSAGINTKKGVWSFSAEGHYGEIDGKEEKSALIGVRYDIARGLAATAALDYQDRQISIDGVNYINTKDTRGVIALSYGF